MKTNDKIRLVLLHLLILLNGQWLMAQEKIFSLEEVKTLAIENNKKIKKANANIAAAKEAKLGADAATKPTVDGSLMGIYLTEPFTAFLPEIQASASANVTQVIYAGGKIQNAKKLSSMAIDLQNAQKELTEDEVQLSAETAYWQLVNAKEKIVLATEYIKMLEGLQKDLQNYFDAGLTYKNDLLKVEVQLNEATLNLKKAEDGVTMSKLNLAQISGIENLLFDVEDDVTGEFSTVLFSEEFSMNQRPEMAILGKAVEMNEMQEKLLEGDRKPTVSVSGIGFAGYGDQIDMAKGKDHIQGFIGLVSVNIPILDWGARKQKVKEQVFKTEVQKLEMQETEELLELEVQSAVLALNQSVKRIELSEKSLTQAEENLRLNQDRFEVGTVVGEDVLEAQVLWQQAQTDILDAKAEFKINEAKYLKAKGAY